MYFIAKAQKPTVAPKNDPQTTNLSEGLGTIYCDNYARSIPASMSGFRRRQNRLHNRQFRRSRNRLSVLLSQRKARQGQGTIGIEAETSEPDQRLAVLEILSSAEVRSIINPADGCKVSDRQKLDTEALFDFSLQKVGHSYYNLVEVNSEKKNVCVTVVVVRCGNKASETTTEMDLYIEYLNDGLSAWNTGLSLEDQGMPTLMCLFALAVAVLSILFWKVYFDVEKLSTHPDLLLVSKVCYITLLLGVMGWTSYYLLYVSSGTPSVIVKSLACYSQWAFELSILTLIALHGTSHFIRDTEIITEVKVVLAFDAAVTFYLAMLRAVEDEEVVEFHWFCWSSLTKWLRLTMALVLLLWCMKGYQEREEQDRELYALLAYAGLVWVCAQPVGIWLSKYMLRFRWKFYQAFFSMAADVVFAGAFLVFLQPGRAGVLFAKENSAQSLKQTTV